MSIEQIVIYVVVCLALLTASIAYLVNWRLELQRRHKSNFTRLVVNSYYVRTELDSHPYHLIRDLNSHPLISDREGTEIVGRFRSAAAARREAARRIDKDMEYYHRGIK